jgi:hypothetical protein
MVLPSFVIQLSSTSCTADTASNANNNKDYNVDWSQLPQGKYSVTWSLNASNNTFSTPIVIPFVYVDLGTSNIFTTTSQSTPAIRTRCIGTLFISSSGTLNCLYADTHTNPPFYLNSRPSNNKVNVSIFNPSGGLWLDKASTPIAIGDYVLNLSFHLLEQY